MNKKYLNQLTRILIPLVFAVCFVTGSFSHVLAADANRIGFIDLQKAVASTKEWKRQFASFKKEMQKEQAIIARRGKRIEKMLEDLNKQSFVLDPTLKASKEKKFREEKREFERYVKDRNEDFTIKERAASEKIIKKILKVVKKIGKDKKLSMIMDRGTVVYASDNQDLTDLVVRTYDRIHK